jgi:hypothetical protein
MNDPKPPHQRRIEAAPAGPGQSYPLARPRGGDARFTIGLALDVAAVLTRHGYPALTGGADLQHWQHILFTGIYTTHGKEPTS